MVQNKSLLREARDKLNRGRQLLRINKNLVNETKLAQQSNSTRKISAHKKLVVRLPLRDMPESSQFFVLGEESQSFLDTRRTQVNPADNSGDAFILLRHVEQEERLLLRLIDLNDDGAVHAIRVKLCDKFVWQEIA